MTCEWWFEDEDSKNGGYCDIYDRDCSGTRDNECCDISLKDAGITLEYDIRCRCKDET